MSFIEKADLGQDIYSELLGGITREDDKKITTACGEAIDLIDSYLNAKYDTDDLFSKTEDERNKTILALARTIAIYKLHKVCNSMTDLRQIDYDDAIARLKDLQAGRMVLKGAKLAGQTDEITPTSEISYFSNPKRDNSF
jgi:phage gp36-like protein